MNILKILKVIIIIILVILLALLLTWSFSSGKKAAQSRQIIKDSKTILSALEYFYQDQNRYPSINEFNDQNVMRQYMNNFPPQEFTSEVCAKTFEYQNSFRSDYELRICLPKAKGDYQLGWNAIKSPQK
jgi:type II secretory pathway pseudopilin PulG